MLLWLQGVLMLVMAAVMTLLVLSVVVGVAMDAMLLFVTMGMFLGAK